MRHVFSRYTHTTFGSGLMPLLPHLLFLVGMGGSPTRLLSTLLLLPQRVTNDSPHLPGPCLVSLAAIINQNFLAGLQVFPRDEHYG